MEKLKRVLIKEEFVKLTGDIKLAIILNQFIYWSERVKDFDKFIAEEKSRAEQSGLSATMEATNGWIYKTSEELAEETMLFSSSTVARLVKTLVEKGWLEERNNPLHKWDRTKQYRVNLMEIHTDLLEIGYCLQDYRVELPSPKTENAFPKMGNASLKMGNASLKMGNGSPNMGNGSPKMVNSISQNDGAIPEITTDNNSFTHSSMHHDNDNKSEHTRARERPVDNVDIVENINAPALRKILTDAGFQATPIEVESLASWTDTINPDMIRYAVKKSVLNGKKSLPYIEGIFRSWLEKGVRSIDQAEKETRYD
jgi:DnaD/phage-associated family protein